ncbi:MAG: L,D-transpeptidase/peptidoglycan binding protein [Thermoleophilia bacterium]|nr:L,D-transpeptidase/peptidoglycan binding protein [Thermoleophilia bacterium]
MGRKTQIALGVIVLLIVVAAAGAFAYDSAQKDKIADGVTVAGVDVGGMDADEARAAVRRELLSPLRHELEVSLGSETWTLPGEKLKVRANIDEAVDEAVAESQDGGLPTRLVRYVSGGELDEPVAADLEYSQPAINRFVRRVAEEVNRDPIDASVSPGSDSLNVIPGQSGRKLRDVRLTEDLEEAVLNADAPHTVVARVHKTKPEVTTKQVAGEYPSYLTLDRGSFTLRLWKDLKLAKTYPVAVGQEGLETPEGLYEIQAKEENPTWHVPESDWAGSLAGATIPPGPSNPIKARWMAIYEGAGIHGTEETSSLGSAASHGCVRMAIPDVEELYDQVEVGTPIYIG